MQCSEFDALLTDAMEGVLSGAALDRFQAHAQSCKACGPLLAEAEAGRNWLKGLTEVEPPANLVANILASTTGVDTQRLRTTASASQPQISWLDRVQASLFSWWGGFFVPVWAMVRQPRFAMSFGMAFFALSVGLTAAGVKPGEAVQSVGQLVTHPSHTYYAAQARVVHYYENVRVVYEFEARLREIKRSVKPAEPGIREHQPEKPKDDKNDTTQQPEQNQERNYSQTDGHLILASAPEGLPSNPDLPVVSVTTYRRFV
jgi:Putative zinc-finger